MQPWDAPIRHLLPGSNCYSLDITKAFHKEYRRTAELACSCTEKCAVASLNRNNTHATVLTSTSLSDQQCMLSTQHTVHRAGEQAWPPCMSMLHYAAGNLCWCYHKQVCGDYSMTRECVFKGHVEQHSAQRCMLMRPLPSAAQLRWPHILANSRRQVWHD
jgi:hypothetical protein